MLIATIIMGTLALVCGGVWLVTYRTSPEDLYREGNIYAAIGFWVLSIMWLILFMFSMNISISTQSLSGYIYSAENRGGYTTAHIRFSENAGVDVQPSICVKTDSKPGREIQELVGTSKKVNIKIQPYFYFANNPFACGTTDMTIKEIK